MYLKYPLSCPLFVTLNPIEQINEKDIFGKYEYEHPIFDKKAIRAQENLDKRYKF